MKKFYSWIFLAVMLFSVVKSGCGGSGGDDVKLPDSTAQTSSVIHVEIDDSAAYETRYKAFYGYTSSGGWVLLAESTNGSVSFDVDSQYTEFGFEFDIVDPTNWLYSGVFYTAAASEVSDSDAQENVSKTVLIILGGTASAPTVEVKVDNMIVVRGDDTLTDTHSRYDWGNAAGDHNAEYYRIKVHLEKTGLYLLNSKALYGRQPGGKWVNITNGTDFTVSSQYTEFGFEFDITWGTDWPYSNVFWTAEQSEQEAVRNIDINMGGLARNAKITIKVNDKVVVYDSDCDSHSRYDWNK